MSLTMRGHSWHLVGGFSRVSCACVSTDLDKLDNEKKDLIQSDIAMLHQFYSKHLEFPDHDSLVVLFAQVRQGAVSSHTHTPPQQHGDIAQPRP